MAADHRKGYLALARTAIATALYPVQHAVSWPAGRLRDLSESFVSRQSLLEENQRLRREQLLADVKLQRFAALEAENRRIRALLGSSANTANKTLVAELLEIQLQPFRQQVTINKGLREGVYQGQSVVDSGGIMGQVIHVNPFSSVVLLLTDPLHSIPVQANRTGLRSIATGIGKDNELILEHFPVTGDLREGDLLLSSGLGGRFPRGYPVATVTSVLRVAGESFSSVTATPTSRFGWNREVLLIWPHEAGRQEATDAAGSAVR